MKRDQVVARLGPRNPRLEHRGGLVVLALQERGLRSRQRLLDAFPPGYGRQQHQETKSEPGPSAHFGRIGVGRLWLEPVKLVKALPPGGGEIAQHATERAVLPFARLTALTGILDAIAARVSSVLQDPDGPRPVLVAQTDTEGERSSSHGGLLLAGLGVRRPPEIHPSEAAGDSLS